MAPKQEILVMVEDGDQFADAIEQWRRSAVVTQLLQPRLALLLADGELPDIPGTSWFSDDVPADVLGTLSPTERLFVAAWRARQTPKARLGEGLSWDAPGFQPPDMPGHSAPGSGR